MEINEKLDIFYHAAIAAAKEQSTGILESQERINSENLALYEKKKEEETENTDESPKEDELVVRVQEFIVGTKNKKDNKDEFYELLNDLEKTLDGVSEENPLYDLYDKLMNLK